MDWDGHAVSAQKAFDGLEDLHGGVDPHSNRCLPASLRMLTLMFVANQTYCGRACNLSLNQCLNLLTYWSFHFCLPLPSRSLSLASQAMLAWHLESPHCPKKRAHSVSSLTPAGSTCLASLFAGIFFAYLYICIFTYFLYIPDLTLTSAWHVPSPLKQLCIVC